MCFWQANSWKEVGKLRGDCLLYFACRGVDIINTSTPFCFTLNNCQAKTTDKIPSIGEF